MRHCRLTLRGRASSARPGRELPSGAALVSIRANWVEFEDRSKPLGGTSPGGFPGAFLRGFPGRGVPPKTAGVNVSICRCVLLEEQ